MLDLKVLGWGPPHNPSERRAELFADWIEAQALLEGLGAPINTHELVDRLTDNEIVASSDDAWVLVGDAKRACRARQKALAGKYPFAIAGDLVEFIDEHSLAYIFCLMASLPEQFSQLRTTLNRDFRDHFEGVVVAAVKTGFPNWSVYPTGWKALTEDAIKKGEIVERIASWSLNKVTDPAIFANANDGQVDVALVRKFPDNRSSFPVILGQCATGVTDWRNKAIRPNIDRWRLAVQFTAIPTKLFAVPFALDDETFRLAASESSGVILDRLRICSLVADVPPDLADALTVWIADTRAKIPLAA